MGNVKIINGYDKVVWGSSIAEVKSAYNGIEDRTNEEDRYEGILCFSQELPKGIMTDRFFYFYSEKLFQVRIIFGGIDNTSENMLYEKFVEKYGKPEDPQEFKKNIDEKTFASCLVFHRTVSDELSIRIYIEDYTEKETKIITYHNNIFEYYNPIISKQIKIDNAKKNIDGIAI